MHHYHHVKNNVWVCMYVWVSVCIVFPVKMWFFLYKEIETFEIWERNRETKAIVESSILPSSLLISILIDFTIIFCYFHFHHFLYSITFFLFSFLSCLSNILFIVVSWLFSFHIIPHISFVISFLLYFIFIICKKENYNLLDIDTFESDLSWVERRGETKKKLTDYNSL
jgi:hypothetical protein